MIVDAPTDPFISTTLNVTQDFLMTTQSRPLNETGCHIKFAIAAKFNHSAPSGWPVLQIRRRVGDNTFNTLVMTELEPRPTGYLNVFEYELLSGDVQSGDVVCIRAQSYYGQRYLLAYQTNLFQPQVYVNVSIEGTNFTLSKYYEAETTTNRIGGCGAATTSTNTPGSATAYISKLSTTYTDEFTTTITSSESPVNETPTSSINKTVKSSTLTNPPKSAVTTSHILDTVKKKPVVIITGSVLGTLVIITLLVVLTIVMFLTYQYKRNAKRFSPNTNTGVSANVSSGALENVYIQDNMLQGDDDQIVSNTCGSGANIRAGTSNDLSLQDNPQEVSLLPAQWNHAFMHLKGISLKWGSFFYSGHCL